MIQVVICRHSHSSRKLIKASFTIIRISSFQLAAGFVALRNSDNSIKDAACLWGDELLKSDYAEDDSDENGMLLTWIEQRPAVQEVYLGLPLR